MKKKKTQQNISQEAEDQEKVVTEADDGSCQPPEEQVTQPCDEIDVQPDELAKEPPLKKQRVWEVDFLRGLMILFVVWDHFMWDVSSIGGDYNTGLFRWLYALSESYYGGTLRAVTHDVFVTLFVFTSGVSCSFSRNNGRRAIKMIVFACAFTAVTAAVSSVIGYNVTIRFNVIHVIALSVLLWTVIEWCWERCRKNWQKNIFGAVMTAVTLTALVVGACAKYSPWESTSPVWFFLAEHKGGTDFIKFCGGDYLPFLPDFGWFLIGAFLGRIIYKEKKSVFPSVNPKYVSPVTFCGRYSIWVYFGSQVVMFGLIYLFHEIWNLL